MIMSFQCANIQKIFLTFAAEMKKNVKQVAIIGGGAAGFFCAVCLKEALPEAEVTIFERSTKMLGKVEISGGGRCNLTNTFEDVRDLSSVYPRGHRLMKRLFNVFGPRDAYSWWERHGVPLTVQPDHCVFPAAQDSHAVIDCLLRECRRHAVVLRTGSKVSSLDELRDFDAVVVTTGGQPRMDGLQWLADSGHDIEPPVPSLFTFRIDDQRLQSLMGTVVEEVQVQLPGTKLRADGPLLVTHWGMSGPAILRLSSYGARLLATHGYQHALSVNWVQCSESEVAAELGERMVVDSKKQIAGVRPFGLTGRLWSYLVEKSLPGRAHTPWGSLNKKELNRLVNVLTNDQYAIAGRAPFKDEFVTCGGVSLSSIQPATLESRVRSGLYFAGEVLDIDGVTGGFNFQAAWTTAFVVAQSIARQ